VLLAPPDEARAEHAGVRFGIFTSLTGAEWSDVAAAWEEAERLGFDSAWVNDHLAATPPDDEDEPQLEGWTTLAALAARTERIRLGVLVTGNPYRNPALLAKMATTVDHVSGGRLDLGIGAGWFEREFEAYGFPFGTDRERAEKLAEALEVITRLWGEKEPSYRGKYYSLDEAPWAPANVQKPRPPIVVGGQGKEWIVPLVARYADGWNASIPVDPEGFRERLEIIRRECERVGRSPCPTRASKMLVLVTISGIPLAGPAVKLAGRVMVGEGAGSLLAGSPAGIAENIQEFVDAGANEIIVTLLPPFDRENLRALAEDIIPRIRPAAGKPPASIPPAR
jgi:F420-dependent oxidoreductase-like protein